MQEWYKFILSIIPDGKAFRSILFSKIFYEVLAGGFELVKNYAVLTLSDQVWYVNTNFDPAPWEQRYEITVSENSTLEQRRTIVKSYMLFPQQKNRLSRDYIESSVINAGNPDVEIVYNPTNISAGYFRANDISDEKTEFTIGTNIFNTFVVTGSIDETNYFAALYLILSIKPLQVGFYDTLDVNKTICYDENYALALDDNNTIILNKI
jgi:hypothetical protein